MKFPWILILSSFLARLFTTDVFLDPAFLGNPDYSLDSFGSLKEFFDIFETFYQNSANFSLFLSQNLTEDAGFEVKFVRNMVISPKKSGSTAQIIHSQRLSWEIEADLSMKNLIFTANLEEAKIFFNVSDGGSLNLQNCGFANYTVNSALTPFFQFYLASQLSLSTLNFTNFSIKSPEMDASSDYLLMIAQSQEVFIENILISNFSAVNYGLIAINNQSNSTSITNLTIISSFFEIIDSQELKFASILDSYNCMKLNFTGFMLKNSELRGQNLGLVVEGAGLFILERISVSNSLKTGASAFILIENTEVCIIQDCYFREILANSLFLLNGIGTFLLSSGFFLEINIQGSGLIDLGTILTLQNIENVIFEGVFCNSSLSFNSPTCLSISNSDSLVGSISLMNCSHFNNTAQYLASSSLSGTAIYSDLSKAGSLFSLINCSFANNSLIGYSSSPCLYSASLEDTLNITFSLFDGNSAEFLETCLYHQGSQLLISHSSFSDNVNQLLDSSSNAAVTVASFQITLDTVTFIRNQATNGAAILVLNSQNKPSTNAAFINLTVTQNTATYSPLLFSSNIQVFSIEISDSLFSNNLGLIKGGVFQTWYALYGNVLTFRNCRFLNNSAMSAGGAAYIANLGNQLLFINCYFLGNQALKDGGGVINMYGDPNTLVTTKDCVFSANTAFAKGGVFLITTGIYNDEGSVFRENQAGEGGIIAINFFSILAMQGSVVENCRAASSAGVMKMMGQSDVTLGNVSVSGCFAPKGGVFVTGGLSVFRVYDCNLSFNEAVNATIMYATNTAYQITINRTIFQGNKGSRNGFELNSCSISLSNVDFIDNNVNLFFLELTSIEIQGLLVKNQWCLKGQSACLLDALSKSEVVIRQFTIENLTSEDLKPGNLQIEISSLRLYDGLAVNFSSLLGGDLAMAYKSSIELHNVTIQEYRFLALTLEQSSLIINSSRFSQSHPNLSTGTGAIQCIACLQIQLLDSQFENISNFNRLSGAVSIIGPSLGVFSLKNCSFERSFGISGGAVAANNSNLSIISCNFTDNYAELGAGVYLFCEFGTDCSWEISSSRFSNNIGTVSGGGIRWEPYVPLTNSPNEFHNNSAFFGPDIASQPVRFSFANNSELSQFRDFSSGGQIMAFSLTLQDYYGQEVKGLQGLGMIEAQYEVGSLYAGSIMGLTGPQIVNFENNRFVFGDLTLIATPESILLLKISSPLIPYFYSKLLSDTDHSNSDYPYIETFDEKTLQYELSIIVLMRFCVLGEIYNIPENTCDLCPFGQFSITPNATVCQECIKNAVCFGGFNISVNPNFWRSHNLSTELYQCQMTGVCLGGFESSCLEGYTGPICDVCTFDQNNKYYKFGGTRCDSCLTDNPLGYIIFGLFYVFMIFYVIFTIKKNIDSVNTVETLNYEIPVFLKIGMDYVQIISAISLLNVRWPTSFSSVLTTSGSAGNLNSIMFPFECLLAKLPGNYNIFYLKIFLGSIFAWFNFIFSGLVWVIYLKVKGHAMNVFKKEIIITIIIVGFTLQPSIVNMYFTALNCIDINGISYVKKQLSIVCWEGDHLLIFFYFVLPSLLLWSVILPGLCFLYVKNNINSKDLQTRGSLIYITKGVRQNFYYWEFVMMAKRYCVSLISAFLISDLTLATSLILVVIMIFATLNIMFKPYNLVVFNSLQEYSFISSFLVFFFCLYYVVSTDDKSQMICIVFLILGLMVFFLRFSKNVLKAYSERLKVIVSRMESYIGSRKKFSARKSFREGQSLSQEQIPNLSAIPAVTLNKSHGVIDIRRSPEKKPSKKLPLKTLKVTPTHNKKYRVEADRQKARNSKFKTQEFTLKMKIKATQENSP